MEPYGAPMEPLRGPHGALWSSYGAPMELLWSPLGAYTGRLRALGGQGVEGERSWKRLCKGSIRAT